MERDKSYSLPHILLVYHPLSNYSKLNGIEEQFNKEILYIKENHFNINTVGQQKNITERVQNLDYG